MQANVNLTRKLDKYESHFTFEIDVNSNDLLEVENITRIAVAEEYPGWSFDYLKST